MKKMTAKNSRGCCDRLRDSLYGVFVESCIITLSLLSGLAVAVEMLITLKILRAPPDVEEKEQRVTGSTQPPTPTTNIPIDPGGGTTGPLLITTLTCHYTSVGIAALFLLEIILKILLTRKAFFVQFWQIFDALVVFGAFSIEVVFTVLGKEIVWEEAATFVVLLRLWRVITVCNIKAKKAKSELNQEIHIWKSAKMKCEEKCASQQDRLDRQQLRIVELERRIVQTTKHLDEIRKEKTEDMELGTCMSEPICNGGVVSNGIVSKLKPAEDGANTEKNIPSIDVVPAASEDVENSSEDVIKVSGNDVVDGGGLLQAKDRRCSDSDSTEDHVGVTSQRQCVVVQIEEPSPQHASTIVTDDTVKLINDVPVPVSYDNQVFDKDDEDVVLHDLPVLAKDDDGTTTYRNSEGIPMTTL